MTNLKFSGWTIGQYIDHIDASTTLLDVFLLSHGMGSFPMPDIAAEDMPNDEIVSFCIIHCIVGSKPENLHIVSGEMFQYVDLLAQEL